MPGKTEIELAARRELLAKAQRGGAVRKKATDEQRDLSRREAAEIEGIKRELDELRERAPVFNPRLAQGTPAGENAREQRDVLAPEERVSDWLRERGKLP